MTQLNIEDLKRTIDLRSFASTLLGKCIHHSNYDVYSCPHHSDRTPSLTIYKNSWYCYSCNEGGSIFDFLMYYKGLSFKEALQEVSSHAPQYQLEQREEIPRPEINLSMDLVTECSSHIKEGLSYFESRGITDPTSYRIPLGVKEDYSSWYQLSSGEWIEIRSSRYAVPNIFDNKLRGINYRRNDSAFLDSFFHHPAHARIMDDLSINYEGHPEDNLLDIVAGKKYKQEPGSKWKPFNVDLIAKREEGKIVYLPQPYLLVYAESKEFDVLATMDAGYPIVGVTLTHELEPVLPKLFNHIPLLYILRDNDEAGMNKAIRLQNILGRGRITTSPIGKDVGDCIHAGMLDKWFGNDLGLEKVLR